MPRCYLCDGFDGIKTASGGQCICPTCYRVWFTSKPKTSPIAQPAKKTPGKTKKLTLRPSRHTSTDPDITPVMPPPWPLKP